MTKDQIKALALASGFKPKQQPGGDLDLNPYVYQFAESLLTDLQITISDLRNQVDELQAHPDSWQSGFDAGRRTMHERSRHWKVWAENQIAKAVPEGHRVVPRHISNDAIERLGLMDNGNQPFFVINDRDDVKALYAAMVSQASKDKKPKPE